MNSTLAPQAPLHFLSLCSGIEAASVAFEPLGWKATAFAEIEAFPSNLLAHHYPSVPNLGDMTKFKQWPVSVFANSDLVVGGPPCQAFSVAGMRKSLGDDRGNLTLTYAKLIDHADNIRIIWGRPPTIAVYENVPGLLSTADNAFGCLLAGLAGEDEALVAPGGKWSHAGVVLGPRRTVAWRTLDAQFFGLAQRRKRVFVVASAREDFDPAQVLLEWDGVRRDSAPSRQAREEVAGTLAARTDGGGFPGTDECVSGYTQAVIGPLTAACGPNGHGGSGLATDKGAEAGHILAFKPGQSEAAGGIFITEDFAPTLQAQNNGSTAVPAILAFGGNNTGGPIEQAAALNANRGCHNPGDFEAGTLLTMAFDTTQLTNPTNASNPQPGDPCHTLAKGAHAPAIAFHGSQDPDVSGDVTHPVGRNQGQETCALVGMQVRRLMPEECEPLQGFRPGYTQIPFRNKPAADGPRYKALGNSWPVPVVTWIGRRIAAQLA